MIVGIDFDNTIADYDQAFVQLAESWGLVESGEVASKKSLKVKLHEREGGDMVWQKLQGHMYGQGISRATPYEGVLNFLKICQKLGIPLYIVSHKTEYGHQDESQTHLHEAALGWMKSNGFFNDLGMRREQIFFEVTRDEKIQRINRLGCTHFIDDLPEVLLDSNFPVDIKKYLFSAQSVGEGNDLPSYHEWLLIQQDILGDG